MLTECYDEGRMNGENVELILYVRLAISQYSRRKELHQGGGSTPSNV